MFARGISILASSAVQPANINLPHPNDLLSDRIQQAAQRAMLAELPRMLPSEIRQNPERHAQLFHARREHLEALLWVEPTQAVL